MSVCTTLDLAEAATRQVAEDMARCIAVERDQDSLHTILRRDDSVAVLGVVGSQGGWRAEVLVVPDGMAGISQREPDIQLTGNQQVDVEIIAGHLRRLLDEADDAEQRC